MSADMQAGKFEVAANRPRLRLADGRVFDLHPLWLRERSRAPDAFDARTSQRLFEPSELALDVAVRRAEALENGAALRAEFSDGCAADFRVRDILTGDILADGAVPGLPPPTLWEAADAPPPMFDHAAVAADDEAKADAADAFVRFGYALIRNVPREEGAIARFANLFGPLRTTGEFGDIFNVRVNPDGNDLAYTALALTGHTDNPYRRAAPEVQLLHAIVNEAEGGESTLADGFMLAELLRAEDPALLTALAETEVLFRFVDARSDLAHVGRIVELDAHGRPAQIRFSGRVDYARPLAGERLDAFYRARRRFAELAESPRCRRDFRLESGMLMMMDNTRLLHGRAAYRAAGRRHLQGCYMDADPLRGLARMRRNKNVV